MNWSEYKRNPIVWLGLAILVIVVDFLLVKYVNPLGWQRLVLPLLGASIFSEYAKPG